MLETLKLGFSERDFVSTVAEEISTPGITPLAAASRYFAEQLTKCLSDLIGPRLIKPPTVELGNWPGRYETLRVLASTGAEASFPEIRFATRPSDALEEVSIETYGFALEPIEHAFGTKRYHDLRLQRLKTLTNHRLRLNHVRFPAGLFEAASRHIGSRAMLSHPFIANPEPHGSARRHDTSVKRFRVVAFDHMTNGDRLFCECARTAHDRMRSSASDRVGQYSPDSWPHRMIRLLETPDYRAGLCHLCVAHEFGPGAVALRYGDDIQGFEDIYIDQLVIGEGLDERTARAEVQRRLGVSRWKSEAVLFQIVKEIVPDAIVQREASPAWLGRQRLDIFLPALDLAIEYQGAQHFGPISLFGGEEGFVRARERDELKKKLCEENGITVVYVTQGDPLTVPHIRRRLQKFLLDA